MKLSARNVIAGRVIAVTKGMTTANVKIDIGNGCVITSAITNEAVADMDIKVGDEVSAIVKSSDVIIGKD
ncbi:transporter [Niveispirillum sp. SYP-B3756]|uniref:TOBE domain-containing protein n=1 Tax=Niveispirillum sp. SYP-B3756 TaxID=2662178 RepID=UPI0012910E78|nr:TOBE domain-containing protein [Niveispirillum sp. SYP-B3756]MQP67872.1 transporter [Niveispirillum sp. SYP-B3756]